MRELIISAAVLGCCCGGFDLEEGTYDVSYLLESDDCGEDASSLYHRTWRLAPEEEDGENWSLTLEGRSQAIIGEVVGNELRFEWSDLITLTSFAETCTDLHRVRLEVLDSGAFTGGDERYLSFFGARMDCHQRWQLEGTRR